MRRLLDTIPPFRSIGGVYEWVLAFKNLIESLKRQFKAIYGTSLLSFL